MYYENELHIDHTFYLHELVSQMQCHLFFVTDVYKHLHEYVDFEKMSRFLVDDDNIQEKRCETETSLSRFKKALDILSSLKSN